MAAGHSRALKPVTRTCTMSVSGARTGAERAGKKQVELWAHVAETMERERSAWREVAERKRSGERAESAANGPLQPNNSLTSLQNVYSLHFSVCSLLFSLQSSVFTLRLLCHFFKPGWPQAYCLTHRRQSLYWAGRATAAHFSVFVGKAYFCPSTFLVEYLIFS